MDNKVAVYISNLNAIGGVETFCINLCNRTGFDMIYDKASIKSLKKLKYNAYQINHNKKEYDVLIISSAWGKNPNTIKAKKYIQVVHADYKAYIEGWNFIYKKLPYTTHHTAVGKHVAKQFELVTDYKIDKVIYNLLSDNVKPKKQEPSKLSFITLSRISKEKGFERMLQVAELMKNVDYEWNIYGDNTTNYAKIIMPKLLKYPQIKFKGLTTKGLEEIAKHSYLVQLSDTEGFCYSIYEALSIKVPVICTNFPSSKELIKDSENGYILEMDLSNFDIEKIKNIPNIKDFKEYSTEKDWFNFINEILNN